MRIASEDWVFHSKEQDLADFVRNLTDDGIKVLLCHNYPKALRRFIKRFGLDARFVFSNSLSEEGIAWKLIISLLPDQHQISMGSHKPVWLKIIPENWDGRAALDQKI